MRPLSIPLVTGLAIALVSVHASASEIYPARIKDELSLQKAPSCTLCHRSASGGAGTVVTAFGTSMQRYGLVAKDPASLDAALEAIVARGVDSDGDGIPDIRELSMGLDPNDGPRGRGASLGPQYGCSETSDPAGGWFWMAATACAVFVMRRRLAR